MWVLKHKNIFLIIAVLLIVGSVVAVIAQGINPSIEFTGGTLVEYTFENKPVVDEVSAKVSTVMAEAPVVQSIGETGVIVRTAPIDEAVIEKMTQAVTAYDSSAVLTRSSTVGPSLGIELKKKALIALVVTSILIILYVAFAFRRVSKPISAWKYGIIVIVTLLHDVIIPFGIIVLLGREFDTLVVVGLLSILGLSVNDTIVVFDRIRENLQIAHADQSKKHHFDSIVGASLSQTVRRSLITSASLILVLVILSIFGPEATQTLALILALGVIFGTYSSIFVASPLLVLWEKFSRKAE